MLGPQIFVLPRAPDGLKTALTTITILESQFESLYIYNDHLSTTATKLEFLGWSLFTSLTVFLKLFYVSLKEVIFLFLLIADICTEAKFIRKIPYGSSKNICEYQEEPLECAPQYWLSITSAFYGRQRLSICPTDSSNTVTCYVDISTIIKNKYFMLITLFRLCTSSISVLFYNKVKLGYNEHLGIVIIWFVLTGLIFALNCHSELKHLLVRTKCSL